MTKRDEEQFAEDVIAGMTVSELATKHGISKYRAQKKMDRAIAEANSGTEEDGRDDKAEEHFEITLNLPASGILEFLRAIPGDEIMSGLEEQTAQVQADLFAAIMQKRFNKELATRTVAMPQLVLAHGD